MNRSADDDAKLAAIRRRAKQQRARQQQEARIAKLGDPGQSVEWDAWNKATLVLVSIGVGVAGGFLLSATTGVVLFLVTLVGGFVWMHRAMAEPAPPAAPREKTLTEVLDDTEGEQLEATPLFSITVETRVREVPDYADEPDTFAEKDNFERFDFYTSAQLPGIGRYHIKYQDQRGLSTERDITIKRVYQNGEEFAVDAHCALRNAHRSFIDDRIEDAVNLDTGEMVHSVARDALRQYEESGAGRALAAVSREWDGVAVLLFICRADGRMLKPERVILGEYLKSRCPDLALDDAALDDQLKQLAEPTQQEFRRLANRFKKGDAEHLALIQNCAARIVATQNSVDPLERAALEILGVAVEA